MVISNIDTVQRSSINTESYCTRSAVEYDMVLVSKKEETNEATGNWLTGTVS